MSTAGAWGALGVGGAIAVAVAVSAASACGDGEASGGGGSGPVTGASVSSTSSASSSHGAGGAGGAPVSCDPAAPCGDQSCQCEACWAEPRCYAACHDDGSCTPDEGCGCQDCASGVAACSGFCLACGDELALLAKDGGGDPWFALPCPFVAEGVPYDTLNSELEGCCQGSCSAECGLTCSGAGPAPPGCLDCLTAACPIEVTECKTGAPIACNPVSGAPCDLSAGAACDAWFLQPDGANQKFWGFRCYPPPNDAGLCEPCKDGHPSAEQPRWCGAGLTCSAMGAPTSGDGTCARYCCDDGDCGSGTCLKGFYGTSGVGICLATSTTPSCDAPATSPSGGSCYTPP
jgi:hypothetical protein